MASHQQTSSRTELRNRNHSTERKHHELNLTAKVSLRPPPASPATPRPEHVGRQRRIRPVNQRLAAMQQQNANATTIVAAHPRSTAPPAAQYRQYLASPRAMNFQQFAYWDLTAGTNVQAP
jgi:hypothetical protein